MSRTLISFDWAIKRLLRQKANFAILEGFLTVLLEEEITISQILESESNKVEQLDKSNKVDILCENQKKELILIELQYSSEYDYFQRMLYGTSKLITDFMAEGDLYDKVRKVISINILYFDLGQGDDYVYHGTTEFKGIHTHNKLQLSAKQRDLYKSKSPSELYPEYYVIKVNNFDNVAKDSLDEWIYYLKNSSLPEKYTAKGLDKVSKILNKDTMDAISKELYDAHIKENRISMGMLETAKMDGIDIGIQKGIEKGIEKGIKKGIEKGIEKIVIQNFNKGKSISFIAEITELSEGEVIEILKKARLL